MHRKRSVLLVLALAVALAGAGCTKGTTTLKAQSITVDSIVLAGETFFLVGDVFNALCPKSLMPLDQCRGFRLYTDGHEPKAEICREPTLTFIVAVLQSCGHRVAYPMVVQAYKDKKDGLVSVASAAEAMIRQLGGFTKTANAAKGK